MRSLTSEEEIRDLVYGAISGPEQAVEPRLDGHIIRAYACLNRPLLRFLYTPEGPGLIYLAQEYEEALLHLN